jgi:glycosyltransferase involved in cell wall biosynthesis
MSAQREGVAGRHVTVTPNGISPLRPVREDEVVAIREEQDIPHGASVIVSVARFRPEKGLDMLIEAASRVARTMPVVHLVLVGDGPNREALKAHASRCADLVVHFPGFRDDVAPWYSLASVVAMPSQREAFGLAAVEALAARRPLVATCVGGLPEIIEQGVSGMLVPPNDPGRLATEITKLLKHPDIAGHLGANGYERYQAKFTLEAMVESWIAGYSEVGGCASRLSRSETPDL